MAATSFRCVPNQIKPGHVLTLKIEGLKAPKQYLKKECVIKVFEVETRGDSRAGKPDLLAQFEATVERNGAGFAFDNVVRKDGNPTNIPIPPKRTAVDGTGGTLHFARDPDYRIPFFMLEIDSISVPYVPPHIVLIHSERRERERYIFEIGFEIWVGGAKKFTSFKHPTRMDCVGILVKNCVEATKILLEDHQDMVDKRGVGTCYGKEFGRHALDRVKFEADVATFGLKGTSCIIYLHDVLRIAHEKVQCGGDWRSIVSGTKGDGMPLALNLEKWGWVGVYFNPDTRNPFDRMPTDPDETNWKKHTSSYREVKRSGHYYGTKAHALVVNYRPTVEFSDGTEVGNLRIVADSDNDTDTVTIKDSSMVKKLNAVPFGIVNVRGGHHTAIFMSGKVWEVHWAESYAVKKVYEARDFWQWGWLDGIIHVPRGVWKG